jgi:hypothetical protein
MNSCKKCGADATGIACEFCGSLQREPADAAEEMEVLRAMSKAIQTISESFNGKGVGLGNIKNIDENTKRNNAMAAWWSGAYMPSTPDALMQALSMALAGVQVNAAGTMSQAQLNAALLARAHATVTALALRAPSDPRVGAARQAIAEVEGRLNAATEAQAAALKDAFKPMMKILAIMVVVLIAVLLLAPEKATVSEAQTGPAASGDLAPAGAQKPSDVSVNGANAEKAIEGSASEKAAGLLRGVAEKVGGNDRPCVSGADCAAQLHSLSQCAAECEKNSPPEKLMECTEACAK